MFIELFKYTKSNNSSINTRFRLEDFTTESLASLIKMFPHEVGQTYFDLIGLPKTEIDEFYISTQEVFFDNQSRNDLYFQNDKTICIVENKVESPLDEEQLRKYCKLLLELKGDDSTINIHLVFCSKYYVDTENIAKEIKGKGVNFLSIRWFQIAEKLEIISKGNPVIQNFLKFLETKYMSIKLSLTQDNLDSIQNFKNTLDSLNSYLERLEEEDFIKKLRKLKKEELKTSSWKNKRRIYFINDIVPKPFSSSKKGSKSDFNYGFYFKIPSVYVGLYINRLCPDYTEVKKLKKSIKELGFIYDENTNDNDGLTIKLEEKLDRFINKEDYDQKILNWFRESFEKFEELFANTKDKIEWNVLKT